MSSVNNNDSIEFFILLILLGCGLTMLSWEFGSDIEINIFGDPFKSWVNAIVIQNIGNGIQVQLFPVLTSCIAATLLVPFVLSAVVDNQAKKLNEKGAQVESIKTSMDLKWKND